MQLQQGVNIGVNTAMQRNWTYGQCKYTINQTYEDYLELDDWQFKPVQVERHQKYI